MAQDTIKKSLIFLFHLIFVSFSLFAQNNDWEWVKRGGGIGNDVGSAIANDENGNVYVTGVFTGIGIWGNDTLYAQGSSHIFLVKYDNLGNVLWAKQGGSKNNNKAEDIVVASNGDCIIVGTFRDTAHFGNNTLITNSIGTLFAIKYDTNGNIIWAKQAEGSGSATPHKIAIDATGVIYITGEFIGTITGGSTTLNNSSTTSGTDVFLWKMDYLGNVLWAKSAGGSTIDGGTGLCLDKNGNIYVSGVCSGVSNFGSIILATSGPGDVDIFLAKYTPQGNLLWAKQYGGGFAENANDMDIDGQNNLYITGLFAGNSVIGNVPLTTTDGATFITKIDANGNVQWAKQGYSQNISGAFGIAVDSTGNNFTTGYFSDTLWIGGNTLISKGVYNTFILKQDTWGNPIWVKQAGGSNINIGNEITLDSKGNAYLTGSYSGNSSFDNISLTAAGSNDCWVGKLKAANIVGIQDRNESQVNVFPNPSHQHFTLENNTEQVIDYEIFNAIGERMYQGKIAANSKENIPILTNKAVYFLHIYDAKKQIMKVEKLIHY